MFQLQRRIYIKSGFYISNFKFLKTDQFLLSYRAGLVHYYQKLKKYI